MGKEEIRKEEDYCASIGENLCATCKRRRGQEPECRICKGNPDYHWNWELDPVIKKVRESSGTQM